MKIDRRPPTVDRRRRSSVFGPMSFVELESLSPLVKLEPDAETHHRETWEVLEGLESLSSNVQNAISNSQFPGR